MKNLNILKELKPEKDFFIGIDSDGCTFDTMEIKHKDCFCPIFIKSFELQPIQEYARETWEFVNLYSRYRGINRFLGLLKVFQLLNERTEVHKSGIRLPDLTSLENWIKKETKLGNPALKKTAEDSGDAFLHTVLDWSNKVNSCVSDKVKGVGPFPGTLETLKIIRKQADIVVVSQATMEALQREWTENGLDNYVRCIAGQEYGTKSEHLALAAKGKYQDEKVLMIGDAPGDYEAARSNGVLFYPIIPGHEATSWNRFREEVLDHFFEGSYEGTYEQNLIREFHSYLPTKPPWERPL